MTRWIIGICFCFAVTAAYAQEPVGCDKFKWPLDKERALLTAAQPMQIASGAQIDSVPTSAITLALVPFDDAKLPLPPERVPKSPSSFAGALRIGHIPHAGIYLVTLSAEAWIDAVQDARYIKSKDFSGVRGCPGIRKSVKFDLTAAPFIIQVSGVATNSITLTVTPSE